jgi:hypothetical protein
MFTFFSTSKARLHGMLAGIGANGHESFVNDRRPLRATSTSFGDCSPIPSARGISARRDHGLIICVHPGSVKKAFAKQLHALDQIFSREFSLITDKCGVGPIQRV